jgi:hypothetical protein
MRTLFEALRTSRRHRPFIFPKFFLRYLWNRRWLFIFFLGRPITLFILMNTSISVITNSNITIFVSSTSDFLAIFSGKCYFLSFFCPATTFYISKSRSNLSAKLFHPFLFAKIRHSSIVSRILK